MRRVAERMNGSPAEHVTVAINLERAMVPRGVRTRPKLLITTR